MNTINLVSLLICIIILMEPNTAYAYLDPGTGSMLIQMLIGGIVAALFTIKMYWYQFKSFIRRKLGKEKTKSSDDLNNNDNEQDDTI